MRKIYEPTNVYGDCEIGEGTQIAAFCDIGDCTIGKGCSIQTGVSIPRGTRVGNYVFLGPQVTICNDKYPPSKEIDAVTIEDNVSIGANSTILPGVTIGVGAMIGAGSVVTKNVPAAQVWCGNPARRLK